MPIKKTDKGWYWGSKGPFKSKRKAQKVAQAVYSSEYQKSFQKGNLTKLLESVLYDLRKENGGFSGTVFTSTNSGIFTPTYGSSKSTLKRKKKIDAKKRGQGLISATKKSGVEKLQRWMSDKSPVKKIKKDVPLSKVTLTGSTSGFQTQPVNNIMRIEWKKPHEESEDPKFVERAGKDKKEQDSSVIEQNNFQRKVTEMDKDNKRKTRGRDTIELDGEVSAAAGVVQLSKQPNKFGNPQDDELLRGSKKDKSKKDGVVDFELTKNTTLQKMDKVIELNETEDIDMLTAISKVFLKHEE
jgi:hypothetical protein